MELDTQLKKFIWVTAPHRWGGAARKRSDRDAQGWVRWVGACKRDVHGAPRTRLLHSRGRAWACVSAMCMASDMARRAHPEREHRRRVPRELEVISREERNDVEERIRRRRILSHQARLQRVRRRVLEGTRGWRARVGLRQRVKRSARAGVARPVDGRGQSVPEAKAWPSGGARGRPARGLAPLAWSVLVRAGLG